MGERSQHHPGGRIIGLLSLLTVASLAVLLNLRLVGHTRASSALGTAVLTTVLAGAVLFAAVIAGSVTCWLARVSILPSGQPAGWGAVPASQVGFPDQPDFR